MIRKRIQKEMAFFLISITMLLSSNVANAQSKDVLPLVEKNSDARSLVAAKSYKENRDFHRYMKLGYQALRNDNVNKASEHFQDALWENPTNQYAALGYDIALTLLNEELPSNANNSDSNYDLYMEQGYHATDVGSYHLALIMFDKALDERPSSDYTYQAIDNVRTYLDLNS